MTEIRSGVLYVDITWQNKPDDGVFVAKCHGHEGAAPDGLIAAGATLDLCEGAVLKWAENWQVDRPIRFRYSERAKLAMQ